MRYQNITHDDMLNGDGLRVVLWVSGCTHHCVGCQNPITWDPDDGLVFDTKAKNEIFDQLKKDYISGITFSGGDPLHPHNRDTIAALAKEIKEKFPTKTIWLYTGFMWEQISSLEVIKYTDIVVDGKYVAYLRDTKLHWRGSSNQRIIDVKASVEKGETIIYCKE